MKAIGFFAAIFFALFLMAMPGTANAQATRTWISGVGDDVNPCSRTAPCKTFAGAISKTATGGEINCLDPGGFGTVTITKSIALVCDQVLGGVLGSSTNGINVNTPAGSIVYLSGLDIQGTVTGIIGVNFIGMGTLHINNSVIRGFNSGAAIGVNFAPTAASSLTITNTIIRDNGGTNSGSGVSIAPASGGGATVAISNTTIANNWFGITVNNVSASLPIAASFINTLTTGNLGAGIASYGSGVPALTLIFTGSQSTNNATGVVVGGANSTMRIGRSTVSGNGTGIKISGGATLRSFGDNQIIDNTIPGPAIPTIPPS